MKIPVPTAHCFHPAFRSKKNGPAVSADMAGRFFLMDGCWDVTLLYWYEFSFS